MSNPFTYGTMVSGNDFANRENELQELTSKLKETIRRFQLESASNVSKSLRALCSKGILRREKGAYVFEDVLFSRWIEKINR